MKTRIVVFLFLLPLSLSAAEVKPGDNLETVQAALGAPRGQLKLSGREILCFDRGEIELRAGVVTRVALRSEKTQAALEARRSADAERARQEKLTLLTEGEAIKTRMLADPAFLATPLSYQVAFWQNFSRKYAAVSAADQLGIARARLAEQQQAVQKQEAQALRIAELEAEARASARADRERSYHPYYDNNAYGYHPFITTASGRRSHDSREADREALACRPSAPAPARSQVSSHTAEVFVGTNWLLWPSPADPAHTAPF